MTPGDRLISFFVAAPSARGTAPPVAPPRAASLAAPAVAVLGEDAPATAAVVAATLAREGDGVALVCLWRAPQDEPGAALQPPALPAAARLAARLAGRGHAATASGRAVQVTLPADDVAAAAEAGRACAAVDVPTVLALAGPRTAALDRLLPGVDAVILAPRGDLTAAALTATAQRALARTLPVPVVCGDAAPERRTRRALAARLIEVLG